MEKLKKDWLILRLGHDDLEMNISSVVSINGKKLSKQENKEEFIIERISERIDEEQVYNETLFPLNLNKGFMGTIGKMLSYSFDEIGWDYDKLNQIEKSKWSKEEFQEIKKIFNK